MAFDATVVRALVHELQPLVGSKITKIHHRDSDEVQLTVRHHGTTQKWIIRTHAMRPGVYRRDTSIDDPQAPSAFCMLLRKYIEEGTIAALQQPRMERIVTFEIARKEAWDGIPRVTMVIEWMGKHSNLILLNPQTNGVLDALKRITPSISQHRLLVPGCVYAPPPHHTRLDPLTFSAAQWHQWVHTHLCDLPLAHVPQRFVQSFLGIGPLLATELGFRATHPETPQCMTPAHLTRLVDVCVAVFADIHAHHYAPQLVQHGTNTTVSVVAVTHLHGAHPPFPSVQEALLAQTTLSSDATSTTVSVQPLLRLVTQALKKLEKKSEKLQLAAQATAQADTYRLFGEHIYAYLPHIHLGMTTLTVPDLYGSSEQTVTIPLDPQQSPIENATRHFHKYQKLRHSAPLIASQIAQCMQEVTYLQTIVTQLHHATPAEGREIRQELLDAGYLATPPKKSPRTKGKTPVTVHGYISSTGVRIYCGRSNVQNENVTHRLASPTDTWLHTRQLPGPHVVIKAAFVDETTLYEAAQLAVWFSSARQSSKVPVDYTLVRHVKKRAGAPMGQVTYEAYATLFITPDEAVIQRLKRL